MDKCRGKGKVTKKPCENWPIRGSTVCRMHGGAAKQVRSKARQRQAVAAANRELARLDVPPVDDPLAVLADLAGQALAFKDTLAAKLNELQSIRYTDDKGSEQLRSEAALFERALDRCERFVTNMAKLGIYERLAQVSEQQAELLADALSSALKEMGLTNDQQREARSRVASHLRLASS